MDEQLQRVAFHSAQTFSTSTYSALPSPSLLNGPRYHGLVPTKWPPSLASPLPELTHTQNPHRAEIRRDPEEAEAKLSIIKEATRTLWLCRRSKTLAPTVWCLVSLPNLKCSWKGTGTRSAASSGKEQRGSRGDTRNKPLFTSYHPWAFCASLLSSLKEAFVIEAQILYDLFQRERRSFYLFPPPLPFFAVRRQQIRPCAAPPPLSPADVRGGGDPDTGDPRARRGRARAVAGAAPGPARAAAAAPGGGGGRGVRVCVRGGDPQQRGRLSSPGAPAPRQRSGAQRKQTRRSIHPSMQAGIPPPPLPRAGSGPSVTWGGWARLGSAQRGAGAAPPHSHPPRSAPPPAAPARPQRGAPLRAPLPLPGAVALRRAAAGYGGGGSVRRHSRSLSRDKLARAVRADAAAAAAAASPRLRSARASAARALPPTGAPDRWRNRSAAAARPRSPARSRLPPRPPRPSAGVAPDWQRRRPMARRGPQQLPLWLAGGGGGGARGRGRAAPMDAPGQRPPLRAPGAAVTEADAGWERKGTGGEEEGEGRRGGVIALCRGSGPAAASAGAVRDAPRAAGAPREEERGVSRASQHPRWMGEQS